MNSDVLEISQYHLRERVGTEIYIDLIQKLFDLKSHE